MNYSTQSPEVTHLYPAALQPSHRSNANCTPVNDLEPEFQHEPRKKIVNGQHTPLKEQRSRQHNDNADEFKDKEAMIKELKRTTRNPRNGSESDPQWVSDKIHRNFEEDVNELARQANILNNIATCSTNYPANIRNYRTWFSSVWIWGWWWNVITLIYITLIFNIMLK